MPYRAFDDQNCSIARSLAVVGERWTLLILREVLLGRRRFAEIRRNTGVATNILSDRLDTLVQHGVLRRHQLAGSELAEYLPTEKGVALTPVLVALTQWGDRYESADGAGPPRVVVHAACGHDADPVLTCSHCQRPIAPHEVRMRPGPGADEMQRQEPLLPAA